jgi:phosphotriesterase-related protein
VDRRAFLTTLAAGVPLVRPSLARVGAGPDEGRILTVSGPVEASAVGPALVHEHVLVDFVGAERVSRSRYDVDEVVRTVVPRLLALRAAGCRTLFEATPAYLGRDPLLLRRLAGASGLRLVTNTGYYGAAGDRYVPAHAWRESASELAARWTAEFHDGIEGTGIRPGFIKIGVDEGSLSAIDRKLVEAAALCHLRTGLTIAVHTGDGEAALDTLATLRRRGVAPEAWVWVHAQNTPDRPTQDWAARVGGRVELDGVSPDGLEAHARAVLDMARRGLLGHVLVSQDAGWYHVGEAGGGTWRPYTFLFERFVPALRAKGLTEDAIRTLLVVNPARAFALRVRRLAGAEQA